MTDPHPNSQPDQHRPSRSAELVVCRIARTPDEDPFGDLGGGVVTLSAADGAVVWTADIGFSNREFFETSMRGNPTVTDQVVLIGSSDGSLLALERADGAVRWSYDAGEPVMGRPYVDGDRVFVLGMDGGHVVELASGARVWRWEAIGPAWFGPPVGDRVYAASNAGIVALDAATGDEVWSYGCNPARQAPAVDDHALYFGTLDYKVLAVELADRAVTELLVEDEANMGPGKFGGRLNTPITCANRLVYLGTDMYQLFACRTGSPNDVVWSLTEVGNGVAVVGDEAYRATGAGVDVLDALTGDRRRHIECAATVGPVRWSDRLYAASTTRVSCIDLGSGNLVWSHDVDTGEIQQLSAG